MLDNTSTLSQKMKSILPFASRHSHRVGRIGYMCILGVWLLFAQVMTCHAQTIAFTFDDGFDVLSSGGQAAIDNAAMLTTLKQHHVRGMLFPSGAALDNHENMNLVRAWSRRGHAIGNHTYRHTSLSDTDITQYFADVSYAQSVLQALPGWCLRLRFPYLDEGSTKEQHNQAMQWLAQQGYGVAAVTIALPDWEYAQHYLDALQSGSDADAATFRQHYLQQVWAQIQTQEAHWLNILKRSPAHVLLLHTNHLNAVVLPDLLHLLKHNGWRIVDPATAFQDPIYQRSYTNPYAAGESLLTLPSPACH